MTSPYPTPSEPGPMAAQPQAKPNRFVGLAWTALILGIVGMIGSPIVLFNNLTAIAAGVGLILGIIALFGTKKILAGIGTALCVAAIAVTVVAQQNFVEDFDRTVNGASGPSLPPTSTADQAAGDNDDAPETNERNYIPKQLGEEAGLIAEAQPGPGDTLFAIDKVEVDPACDEFGMPPESGHTLLLHVRVATGTNTVTAEEAAYVLHGGNFVEIGSGVTSPAQFGTCADYTQNLAQTFGVNQKYSGTIEIVVPEASGTLALAPAGGLGGPAGWEWNY